MEAQEVEGLRWQERRMVRGQVSESGIFGDVQAMLLGGVGIDDPDALGQSSSSGKRVDEPRKLVVIGRIEARQTLEIWAGHDQGGDEIEILVLLLVCFGRFRNNGDLQDLDMVGQIRAGSQCTAEKFESRAMLNLELLLGMQRRVTAHEVDFLVSVNRVSQV